MACRIRYLNSAGINIREIKGIDALAAVCPSHWLLYASLTCYPPNNSPIEMDVFLVTDEQILLLELKDWNGDLTQTGDRWFIGKQSRGRSAVALLGEKARKVKTIVAQNIPQLARTYVDFRVIFTGSSTAAKLDANDQQYCWTLAQTAGLATREGRQQLIGQHKLPAVRPSTRNADFERMFGNTRLFRPREMDWDGYRIAEENIFVHPRNAWKEHRAEQIQDTRVKALLRLWDFDALPPGLNSPQTRRLVADREKRVQGYLRSCESWLVERSGVLTPGAPPPEEVLTQHHEILSVPTGWSQLRRYLERNKGTLSSESRRDLINSILGMVSELHRLKVAHRDLGPSCFWVGAPTRLGLTGFMSAQTPEDVSVANWLTVLRGYAPALPEDSDATLQGTAQQRDVFNLALVAGEIAGSAPPIIDSDRVTFNTAAEFPRELTEVLEKATARDPVDRYDNAIALADAFGEIFVEKPTPGDTSGLDAHETNSIPFVKWKQDKELIDNGRCVRYESHTTDGTPVVVKVWPGVRRGHSPSLDLAMLGMFEGALRLKASPALGLTMIEDGGLSRAGPFLVCRRADGIGLAEFRTDDPKSLLHVIEHLCRAVIALHDIGCSHADLSPANILIQHNDDAITLTVIDLFDLAEVGDGRMRNLAYAPEGWERLSDAQIDRYAVMKISDALCGQSDDAALSSVRDVVAADLEREFIETLEPLLETTHRVLRSLAQPVVPEFAIAAARLPAVILETDAGTLSVKREHAAGATTYGITDSKHRLTLRVRQGTVEVSTVEELPFWSLATSARDGTTLPMRVATASMSGAPAGVEALIAHIENHMTAPVPVGSDFSGFSTRDLWQRSVELEGELMPEITIRQRVGGTGLEHIYQYESEASFDFDEDSTIEARTLVDGRQRTVGQLDLNRLGENILTIQNQNRPFAFGEVVTLVDRRARVSIDRRRRAVDRIVRQESAIPDLLAFFDPTKDPSPAQFDLVPVDDDLKLYGLNIGQGNAFRDILQSGPVSLLQGPPGTGKTRFIAALIHWLIVRGGARKILLASQAHEAVNNAADEIIKAFGAQGGRAHLLRIGAKGITDRLRPFHTTSLRESYHNRFSASLKARIAAAAGAIGISRSLIYDLVDLDRAAGDGIRRIQQIELALKDEFLAADEIRRLTSRLRVLQRMTMAELGRVLDLEPTEQVPLASLFELGAAKLLERHRQSTPADLAAARRLLTLSREWAETLQSGHRNFEEFLAKTRTVVAGTCVGLGQTRIRLEANSFDWVIVDEAARCTASELAVPLQLGRRILLVGDHLQLLPMLPHDVALELREELPWLTESESLRSDFERAFTSSYGRKVGRVLHEQYRMSPKICQLVSDVFYAPHGVKLQTSPDREPDPRFQTRLQAELAEELAWIDTSSIPGNKEQRRNGNKETWNDVEIDTIIRLLERMADQESLITAFAKDEDPAIGIICMYKTQKERLERAFSQRPFEDRFRRMVKIDTVDAYQGKQNSIVIVSLVRANQNFEPGHVRSPNRCNVALSRARERLFIVGSLRMWKDARNTSPMQAVAQAIVGGAGSVLTAENAP